MKKKKILIIDDETDFTDLVKLTLEETGQYEVMEANSAAEGLEAVSSFRPQLIFLDLMMPDIDGAEAAGRLKENPETREIPLVFLTGMYLKEEAKDKGRMVGGYPFLSKPVNVDELLECIQTHLRA